MPDNQSQTTHKDLLDRIASKAFDDLDDEELAALDREIAKTHGGMELLKRVWLPQANWRIYR